MSQVRVDRLIWIFYSTENGECILDTCLECDEVNSG
jgi:hypothetical protein